MRSRNNMAIERSVILTIANKELREIIRDGRFGWLAAIMAMLLLTSLISGWQRYSAYQAIFDNIVATLRVFRQKASSGDLALKKKDENLLDDSTFIPDQGANADIGNQKKKAGGGGLSSTDMMLYGGVGLALLVGIMIAKKKKK